MSKNSDDGGVNGFRVAITQPQKWLHGRYDRNDGRSCGNIDKCTIVIAKINVEQC